MCVYISYKYDKTCDMTKNQSLFQIMQSINTTFHVTSLNAIIIIIIILYRPNGQ